MQGYVLKSAAAWDLLLAMRPVMQRATFVSGDVG